MTPRIVPEDFDELLTSYTRHGFRVIAFAAKSIPGLTWIKAQRMKREQVESGLRFLGFIIFENRLKVETTPVIHTLKTARIGTRMCTGDNIRTAVSVARECGMVRERARVYMPRFVKGDQNDPKAVVEWADVDDESLLLDNYALEPVATDDDESSLASRDWAIAVSGDVFRWVIDYASLETLQRVGLSPVS
jgi:cation-transporting ATPase 13A2